MPLTEQEITHLLDTFDWQEWGERMRPGVEQHYRDILIDQGSKIARESGFLFNQQDPFLAQHFTSYIGDRIVTLQGTTKADVIAVVRDVLAQRAEAQALGTTFELGTVLTDHLKALYSGYARWRCDRIARTETGFAYNRGTLIAAQQGGYTHVDVSDGDDDAICAAANGATWTVPHALEKPLGHPNCTRAFTPHVDDTKPLPTPAQPIAPPPAPLPTPKPVAPPVPATATMRGAELRAAMEEAAKLQGQGGATAHAIDLLERQQTEVSDAIRLRRKELAERGVTDFHTRRRDPEYKRLMRLQTDLAGDRIMLERELRSGGLSIDRLRKEFLAIDPARARKLALRFTGTDATAVTIKQNVKNAAAFVASITDRSRLPRTRTVTAKIEGAAPRASCGAFQLNLSRTDSATTVAHELGHYIEHQSPKWAKAMRDFLDRRTVGEAARPLQQIQPGYGYETHEIAKPDKFRDPYTGKIYSHGSTEVLSMGVQYLYEDPLLFARTDPDYFDVVINFLRGHK